MSVIALNLQTGRVHFTMKGADSEMARLMHDFERCRYREAVEQRLGVQ